VKITMLPDAEPRPRHVAIGTFDGVHLGHQAVIDHADTVLTFDPHPLTVLRPEAAPKLISTFSLRRDVIDGLGVEELVVIPFDEAFSHLGPDEFVREILVERLGARKVSIGENFHFGARAKGTPRLLAKQAEFETRLVSMIEIDGEPVSSTRIRGQVERGEMVAARRCLGAPFMVEGTVVEGDRRGRELGFPTANLFPGKNLVTPASGIYAAFADGVPAAVNVGYRPTFENDLGLLIEVHLIGREEDLYGRTLRVAFVERLRGEERFERVEDLVAQIGLDIENAKRACAAFTERPPANR